MAKLCAFPWACSEKTPLKNKIGDGNLFEKGKTDNFTLRGANVGEISKINLSHDGKGLGAGWYCEKVEVTNKLNNNKIYSIFQPTSNSVKSIVTVWAIFM